MDPTEANRKSIFMEAQGKPQLRVSMATQEKDQPNAIMATTGKPLPAVTMGTKGKPQLNAALTTQSEVMPKDFTVAHTLNLIRKSEPVTIVTKGNSQLNTTAVTSVGECGKQIPFLMSLPLGNLTMNTSLPSPAPGIHQPADFNKLYQDRYALVTQQLLQVQPSSAVC